MAIARTYSYSQHVTYVLEEFFSTRVGIVCYLQLVTTLFCFFMKYIFIGKQNLQTTEIYVRIFNYSNYLIVLLFSLYYFTFRSFCSTLHSFAVGRSSFVSLLFLK